MDIVSNFVAFSQYLNFNILSGAWNLDWLILIFERSRLVKNSTLKSLIFYFILIMIKNRSSFSLTWSPFTSLVPSMNIGPIDQKMTWNPTFDLFQKYFRYKCILHLIGFRIREKRITIHFLLSYSVNSSHSSVFCNREKCRDIISIFAISALNKLHLHFCVSWLCIPGPALYACNDF